METIINSREPHVLRQTTSNDRPQQVILLDVQSKRDRVLFDADHWYEQFSNARLMRFRLSKGEKSRVRTVDTDNVSETWAEIAKFLQPGSVTYLFAMNAFEALTLLGFWEQLASKTWEIVDSRQWDSSKSQANKGKRWRGYAVLERPPTIINCRLAGTNKTLKIMDPQNFGIRGWDDMIPYYVPHTNGADLCDSFSDDPGWQRVQHIFALESWLNSFLGLLDSHDLGSIQNTSASQAMHSFRHRFMATPIVIHGNEPAIKLERQAYHGGRCEAYMLGQIGQPNTLFPVDETVSVEPKVFHAPSKIYHLDVSSMYLALTSNAIVPTMLEGYYQGDFLQTEPVSIPRRCVIADIDIDTKEPIYPKLTDDGLCFPVGKFRTQLCGPELDVAVEKGHVSKVYSMAVYAGEKAFEIWSRMWCEVKDRAKRSGNRAVERMAKSIGVSLFGKFGQQNWSWVTVDTMHAVFPYEQWIGRHPKTNEICHWRSFVWEVQYQGNKEEHYHSFPGLAAWVTSLGRICLWQLMVAAGRRNVYYVDTDSLWTNEEGYNNLKKLLLIGDGSPGMLRLVETVSSLYIWGIKHYRADNRIVCAGLSSKATSNEFGLATWEEQESMKAAMWLRRPAEGNLVKRTMEINSDYRLGKVTKEGRIEPLHIAEF